MWSQRPPDRIKHVCTGSLRSDTLLFNEEAQKKSASVNVNEVIITICWNYLAINTKACKRCITSIKWDRKKRDERELMHIMSGLKRMRRITATLGDQERGGESLRVSAFKYLNHAPVTPFPHVDISVYQNEGWQKTSELVCVQTACADCLMEPATSRTLMHFLGFTIMQGPI